MGKREIWQWLLPVLLRRDRRARHQAALLHRESSDDPLDQRERLHDVLRLRGPVPAKSVRILGEARHDDRLSLGRHALPGVDAGQLGLFVGERRRWTSGSRRQSVVRRAEADRGAGGQEHHVHSLREYVFRGSQLQRRTVHVGTRQLRKIGSRKLGQRFHSHVGDRSERPHGGIRGVRQRRLADAVRDSVRYSILLGRRELWEARQRRLRRIQDAKDSGQAAGHKRGEGVLRRAILRGSDRVRRGLHLGQGRGLSAGAR